MAEISIHIKNSETKLVEKYHEPQGITLSAQDPQLLKMVNDTVNRFLKGTDEQSDNDLSIVVKATLVIQG